MVQLTAAGRPHCTGTLVAPAHVLTAAHCVILAPPASVTVGAESIAVAGVDLHPRFDAPTLGYDVALVRLVRAASLPPVRLSDAAPAPGALVRLVGYGDTGGPTSTSGARLSGTARVSAVGDLELRIEAAPSQPCLGDSGGPAFATSADGESLAGVISSGDAQCASFARLIRADVIDDFIAVHAPHAFGGCSAAGRALPAEPLALLLVPMLVALARAQRRYRAQRRSAAPRPDRGAVATEFIIAIIPFLLLLFGLIQLALAGSARLLVAHAAFGAARAAVVTPAPQRQRHARDAAIFALAPSAPSRALPEGHGETSVGAALDDGVGGNGAAGALARTRSKLNGAAELTAVTLRNAAGARPGSFRRGESLTARVTYLYRCELPLAGRFFGRPLSALPAAILDELRAGGLPPSSVQPGHYFVLQAEHTLIAQ